MHHVLTDGVEISDFGGDSSLHAETVQSIHSDNHFLVKYPAMSCLAP